MPPPRLSLLVSFLLVSPPAFAEDGYHRPAPQLAALVDAPLPPLLQTSPDRSRALFLVRSPVPSIAELAEPELRLAGLRFNPRTLASIREVRYTGLVLKSFADGVEAPVAGFPEGARLANASWSPDSRNIAVVVIEPDKPGALWIVDASTARARALTGPVLNSIGGSPIDWVDGDSLLALVVPAGLGAPPARTGETISPVIQQSSGEAAAARTYQDLLSNRHDEDVFDHYATSEVIRVSTDGSIAPLGIRGIVSANPSPDGRYVLINAVVRPYSYNVPFLRFPMRIAVHAIDGSSVRTIAELPLADNVPIPSGSVRTGPRNVSWRADAPATLVWFEARDGGDGGRQADVRDEMMSLAAPFAADPAPVLSLGYRASGIMWGDAQRAIVSEFWIKTRRTRAWLFNPSGPGAAPRLLFDRSYEDRYSDPGLPVMRAGAHGRPVMHFSADSGSIYLTGTGASPEGDRPFLDSFELATGKANRLWQSAAPHYEEFVAFLDDNAARALVSRESVDSPLNYHVRDLGTGAMAAFTDFPHPYPQFAGVRKELIQYPRADGVTLTGTLYLPPGWTPAAGPLPTLLWAYPREFKSADAAGQVRSSPHRFVRISTSGPLPYLLLGYAVLDDPAMPIIGEGDREPNDSYVKQLVASAQAAIDELVRRGVSDPERVAVGGHSYGAFMTANLLAHSDLFRAGIARSGAYNRTLTPFGFQAEDRTFWQAPGVYAAMSPFNHADKIKDAILLIHGQADDNSGTFPVQSERMYQALKGHGATVRYVQLPHESHGYRARESLLHVLWETSTWLDTFVKNPPARDKR